MTLEWMRPRSLMEMEASYFETRQTGNLMSVLSADVAQLEDVISDASTSIIRIVTTLITAFVILFWMSPDPFDNPLHTVYLNCANGNLVLYKSSEEIS